MSIHDTQVISGLDPTTLPDTQTKTEVLPGARHGADDALSMRQVRVILAWAQRELPGSTTWADAVDKARETFVRGNQRDFNIVQGIIEKDRQANSHESLTGEQERLLSTVLKALDSTPERTPHWEPNIERRIEGLRPRVRAGLYDMFALAESRGQFSSAMDRFSTLCGRPQPRPGESTETMGETGVPSEPDSDDEEPF
jgi:hypothetical protein